MPKFSRNILAYFFILVAFFCENTVFAEEKNNLTWKPIARGLEIGKIDANKNGFFSSEIILIRFEPYAYFISLAVAKDYGYKRLTTKELCQKGKASLCINANFFDEAGDPLGLVMKNGIKQNKIHSGGSLLDGIFAITRKNSYIVPRSSFTEQSILDAVQAGPLIIYQGKKIHNYRANKQYSRRSGICIKENKQILIYITSPGITAVSIDQLTDSLIDTGCRDALNFDGGGSSQMYISGELPDADDSILPLEIQGRDAVPVALTLNYQGEN